MNRVEILRAIIDALGRTALVLSALGVTAAALFNLRRHYRRAVERDGTVAGEAWQGAFFAVVVSIIALAGSGNTAAAAFFKDNGEVMGLLFSGSLGIWLTYKGHNARVQSKTGEPAQPKGEANGD